MQALQYNAGNSLHASMNANTVILSPSPILFSSLTQVLAFSQGNLEFIDWIDKYSNELTYIRSLRRTRQREYVYQ